MMIIGILSDNRPAEVLQRKINVDAGGIDWVLNATKSHQAKWIVIILIVEEL